MYHRCGLLPPGGMSFCPIFPDSEGGQRSYGIKWLRAAATTNATALSANMSETATPGKFRVEGETGLERDERNGAGPGWAGDRGGGEGDPSAVHGGVQAEDRPGGRRLQDAGRGRSVAAAGGVVLLPSEDVARGAGAGGAGRGAEEAWPRAASGRSPRQTDYRAGAGAHALAAARRAG